MAEIIKFYKQALPKGKFVGKAYSEKDKVNDNFSYLWGQWFENGLFAPLEARAKNFYEDWDAYWGMCGCSDAEMKYWIGMFLPENAEVPEGYDSMDIDACELGVFWIYGVEPDVYRVESQSKLAENGCEWKADKNGIRWMIERYGCPRYTTPDEKGNIILDHCYFI